MASQWAWTGLRSRARKCQESTRQAIGHRQSDNEVHLPERTRSVLRQGCVTGLTLFVRACRTRPTGPANWPLQVAMGWFVSLFSVRRSTALPKESSAKQNAVLADEKRTPPGCTSTAFYEGATSLRSLKGAYGIFSKAATVIACDSTATAVATTCLRASS